MTDSALLSFEDIRYTYPTAKNAVLNHFDLHIHSGSITAILGPNGAGKTTLLHLALGWLKPEEGTIRLNGQLLHTYSRRQMGQWIGLVPQNENTPFEFSLLDFVLLGRTPYLSPLAMPGTIDIEIARQKLEEVGMAALSTRSVPSLSGGERQLVLVARALAQQPKILLLDEPTSHLDLSNKSKLVEVLRKLQQTGVTILFTTHEPDVASALATHMVLMRRGQVLASGIAAEVMNDTALSNLYDIPIQVREIAGKRIVLWDH